MFSSTEGYWEHLGTSVSQQSIFKVEWVQKRAMRSPENLLHCEWFRKLLTFQKIKEKVEVVGSASVTISRRRTVCSWRDCWLVHEDMRRFSGWKLKWDQFRLDAHFWNRTISGKAYQRVAWAAFSLIQGNWENMSFQRDTAWLSHQYTPDVGMAVWNGPTGLRRWSQKRIAVAWNLAKAANIT